ncbi:hypothetical protein [Undibacterium sp. Tian12W]|uniref:hypothetical protein n=1 Tax=Undibacterium sp. Tian12W TaxID=3413054 RepID=UPI003BF12048
MDYYHRGQLPLYSLQARESIGFGKTYTILMARSIRRLSVHKDRNGNVGTRTSLFIDWLTQTMKIERTDQQEVRERLMELAIAGVVLRPDKEFSELTKSYKYAYRIPFGEGKFCNIQIDPRKPTARFMRIEWNPSAALGVCPNPFERIFQCLRYCIPSFTIDHIMKATVTRIDLSLNLRRVSMESLLVHTILRKSVSGKYCHHKEEYQKNGKLHSIEIGKTNGDQYLLIYNKNYERECKQIEGNPHRTTSSNANTRANRIKADWTRFELRLRKLGTLERIHCEENPFEAYTVINFINCGQIRNDHIWHFFIDSCKLRGAQATLSLITNRRERKKFADSLKSANPPDWWNAADIWSEFPDALRRILLTSSNSLGLHTVDQAGDQENIGLQGNAYRRREISS